MALKFLLVVAVLAVFVNGQFDDDDDDDVFGSNLKYHYMPALPLPPLPKLPNIPGLPQPPALPTPPPLLMLGPLNFPKFPPFPKMPEPEMPTGTLEDIINASPSPGGTYDSVILSSHSKGWRDESGEVKRKGGSTVILNDNGKVTVEKLGEEPPEVVLTKKSPFNNLHKKFKHFKPDHHPFPHFKPDRHPFPDFKPDFHRFPEPEFKPFDPNYVPKEGENFVSTSSSSSSYSSNVDGKKSNGGHTSVFLNNNGDIHKEGVAFDKTDPEP